MKKHLLAAALAFLATPASAALFNVSVTGVLNSQTGDGADQNLSVGSVFNLTASFDAGLLIPWGDTGYSVAGLYRLPTSGDSFFRIDAPGLTWRASDSILDNRSFFSYDSAPLIFNMALPALIISGDKVVGIAGDLLESASDRPDLHLGSSNLYGWYEADTINGVTTEQSSYSTPILSDHFTISAANGIYFNNYVTQGFSGIWDFADSSVVDPPSPSDLLAISAVPEPGTWTMFLLGFWTIGWTLRLQRRAKTAGPAQPKALAYPEK